LSVEEAPVVSVPVVASENWMKEPPPAKEPPAAKQPEPARFMSQEEDEEESAEEESDEDAAFFFSASTPTVATTVSVAAPPTRTEVNPVPDPQPEPEMRPEPGTLRAQFDELNSEPLFTPFGRDFPLDFDGGLPALTSLDEHRAQPATALFSEPDEDSLRELDTPTFMRRLQF
jgi:cell division protein FtsZ